MNDFTITKIGGTPLTIEMPFKLIKVNMGNSFMFQADDGTEFGTKKEGTPITFEQNFWLCAYPTTQELWEAVVLESGVKLNATPSRFKGKTRPVEQVRWDDVQIFNKAFNKLLVDGKVTFEDNKNQKGTFSLPTETQWEYAGLAGTKNVYAGSDHLDDVGWYTANSNDRTMPVGLKQPNASGLYDMSGNVWEWCQNDYETIEKNGNAGPNKDGAFKALRGGGYFNRAQNCRLRDRRNDHPDGRINYFGFRLRFSPSSTENNENQ